jgi:asparagine synthase (glutamine-hydrolysing)
MNREPETHEVAAEWVEFAVLPRSLADAPSLGVIEGHLRSLTGGATVARVDSGDDVVLVASRDREAATASSLDVVEGSFPEPVGMRVAVTPRDWTVTADRYATRGIFHGRASAGRVVSTRIEVVAALTGAALSRYALHERLCLDFNLGERTLYEGVSLFMPGATLASQAAKTRRDPAPAVGVASRNPNTGRLAFLDDVGPIVADAFSRGASLELTGGIDSRLLLAIGLAAGAAPRLAITVGSEQHDDVLIAQRICSELGIDHAVGSGDADLSSLVADGREFVSRSGYGANACFVAALPAAFRELGQLRQASVSGSGGEIAEGFYYTPLDRFCTFDAVAKQWVQRRLFITGRRARGLFAAQYAEGFDRMIIDEAVSYLEQTQGTWRDSTDALYREQRMRQWAGPVLAASRWWYRPVLPFLSAPYLQWSASLDESSRLNRRGQRDAIAELRPDLAEIPYAGHANAAGSPRKQAAAEVVQTFQKTFARLRGSRSRPDVGVAKFATRLASDRQVRDVIMDLGARALGLPEEAARALVADPQDSPREFGLILTAAWAEDARAELARKLAAAARAERSS